MIGLVHTQDKMLACFSAGGHAHTRCKYNMCRGLPWFLEVVSKLNEFLGAISNLNSGFHNEGQVSFVFLNEVLNI